LPGRGAWWCEDAVRAVLLHVVAAPADYYGGPYGPREEYDGGNEERGDYDRGSEYACAARDMMCSKPDGTICCPRRRVAAPTAMGPYCCESDERGRGRH